MKMNNVALNDWPVPHQYSADLHTLWLEYEAQETRESRWVKVMDRLLPFLSNLGTEGKSWRGRSITRSQVLWVDDLVRQIAPDIFEWMLERIDESVRRGWLKDE